MKMSCAISSRAVMLRIQRFTVAEALIGAGLGNAFFGAAAPAASAQTKTKPGTREKTTFQFARFAGFRALQRAGPRYGAALRHRGLPYGIRFRSRLTERIRFTASVLFFAITAL